MHVRLWAALSGAILFILILTTASLLWLCVPFVWNGTPAVRDNPWLFRCGLAVVCLITAVYAAALIRVACTLFPMPKGVRVRRSEAPLLWREVDRVALGLGAPRVHAIVLDGRACASICSRRSWCLLGWRHCLVLGMPLLRALPPEEVRAVVAHELAHLQQGDTTLSRSVYRAHALWQTLDHLAARRREGALERFIRRMGRRGRVVSQRHGRRSEIAADRACLRIGSGSVCARALVRTVLADRQIAEWLHEHDRLEQAAGQPAPADRMERIERLLDRQDPRAHAWLTEQLSHPNWPFHTHPCLRSRLKALTGSCDAVVPAPITIRECTASAWLGTFRKEVASRLSAAWLASHAGEWRLSVTKQAEYRDLASKLEARFDSLNAAELRLLAIIGDARADHRLSRRSLERLAGMGEADAMSHLQLGRILLLHGTPHDELTARGCLHRAIEMQPDLEWLAQELLGEWHGRAGRVDLARQALDRTAQLWRRALHEQARGRQGRA